MPARRVLSLWFPRLAAERVLRAEPQLADTPLAVTIDVQGVLALASLSAAAEAAGLRRGMALGDARAVRPDLVTRPEDPLRAGPFLAALRRWAGRFSPWVAAEPPESLALDVTGCAHLFGGEPGLIEAVETAAADLRLSVRLGVADTLGAAWALARYAGATAGPRHAVDAIEQEAHATRSRAQKRRWERGGAPPPPAAPGPAAAARIAAPGAAIMALAPLPVAALRLGPAEVAGLQALGLARVGDLAAVPRAQLARRFGPQTLRRLDQALGRVSEPVAPDRPDPVFALRLTLPEPIGLEADVLAGLDRLLGPLCARLRAAGRGARRARLTLVRVDRGAQSIEAGLARPADTPEAIRPLLALKTGEIDAGFGIEALRLEALDVEPLAPRQHRGQLEVTAAAVARGRPGSAAEAEAEALADLIGRLGARLGLEALTRIHPADSHIPEKSAAVMAAGFSVPAGPWPAPPAPRPIVIFRPEPLRPQDAETPPATFVWRRRARRRAVAFGPERIAPEWWLDDPAWRSGPRDYWRVETTEGERLWLYEAKGAEIPGGWFAQGVFA